MAPSRERLRRGELHARTSSIRRYTGVEHITDVHEYGVHVVDVIPPIDRGVESLRRGDLPRHPSHAVVGLEAVRHRHRSGRPAQRLRDINEPPASERVVSVGTARATCRARLIGRGTLEEPHNLVGTEVGICTEHEGGGRRDLRRRKRRSDRPPELARATV